MTNQQSQKGRGCFFYGCLTLVVLLLVGAVGTFLGVRHDITRLAENYTDTQPMELPSVTATSKEAEAVQNRMEAFADGMENGTSVEPLLLSERDLNVLIAGSPDFSEFKDKVYISLEEDQIKGQLSYPLKDIGLAKIQGRFLNGAAGFKASLEHGVLIVTLESLQVRGKDLPEKFMVQLRRENLAKEAYKDPDTAAAMRKLESIEVKDGQIIIRPRTARPKAEIEEPAAVEDY